MEISDHNTTDIRRLSKTCTRLGCDLKSIGGVPKLEVKNLVEEIFKQVSLYKCSESNKQRQMSFLWPNSITNAQARIVVKSTFPDFISTNELPNLTIPQIGMMETFECNSDGLYQMYQLLGVLWNVFKTYSSVSRRYQGVQFILHQTFRQRQRQRNDNGVLGEMVF